MQGIFKHRKIIFLFGVVILIAVIVWAWLSCRDLPKLDYQIDDWRGDHAVFKDGGFVIDDELRDSGTPEDFLWGPYGSLKKGSYAVSIRYSVEEDQNCIASTVRSFERQLVDASPCILSRHLNAVTYQFEAKEDLLDFFLVFRYSGRGDYAIHSISINPTNVQVRRTAVEIILLVLIAEGLVWFSGRDAETQKTILILAGITFLVSLPLFISGIHNGHDLEYHLLRIESVADAIRSGQFPARISTLALYGLGYPFSIYYNDVFLYIPAFFRLMGFSVTAAYKIYAFLVNLATVGIAYVSFKTIFENRRTGLVLTLLYASASYRMVNILVRSALGEYTAQAFLPLLALALYRIYSVRTRSGKEIFFDSLMLAAALSGVIGSHILSVVMCGFLLVLFALYFLKETFRKQTLLTLVSAFGLTLLLNLYFLVPLLDYYLNVPSSMEAGMDSAVTLYIQQSGIFPGTLFGFFQSIFGVLLQNVSDRFQLTPGLPLIAVFFIGAFVMIREKGSRRLVFFLLFSLLTLWLSLDIFPWNWMAIHVPLWDYLVRIQFPWRFLMFSVLFLTLLAGEVLNCMDDPRFALFLTSSAVLMSFWFIGSYFDQANIAAHWDTAGLDASQVDTHFFLPGSTMKNFHDALDGQYGTNMEEVRILARRSDSLTVYCRAGNDGAEHLVTVPVYAYAGYHVKDGSGDEYPIIKDEKNRISFALPDGFDGDIEVVFIDPPAWRAALYVSAALVILLIAWIALCRKNRPVFSALRGS